MKNLNINLFLLFITPFVSGQTFEIDTKKYLDSNKLDPIEGIWEFENEYDGVYVRVVIQKSNLGDFYEERIVEILDKKLKRQYKRLGFDVGDLLVRVEKTETSGTFFFTEAGLGGNYECILNSIILNCKYDGFEFAAFKSYPLK